MNAKKQAHFIAQERHAQRSTASKTRVPETIETETWMTEGMELCRHLSENNDNLWGLYVYQRSMNISEVEADRQLRRLCGLGFLRMGVERADGKFVRFTFGMTDVNLPR